MPPLFLYLNEVSHADTWVNGGGPVPINPASHYRSQDRRGIMTPDEVLQRTTLGVSDDQADIVARLADVQAGNVRIINCKAPDAQGRPTLIRHAIIDADQRDSLILCFSKTLSPAQARLFGGKAAVVRILSPERLLAEINEQLGAEGELRHVRYTRGLDRGDFVKSIEVGWQSEMRMRWPCEDGQPREVMLSAGHGELIELATCSHVHGDMPMHYSLPMRPRQPPPSLLSAWGVPKLFPTSEELRRMFP